LKDEMITPT